MGHRNRCGARHCPKAEPGKVGVTQVARSSAGLMELRPQQASFSNQTS
jgi:hypothetical protein